MINKKQRYAGRCFFVYLGVYSNKFKGKRSGNFSVVDRNPVGIEFFWGNIDIVIIPYGYTINNINLLIEGLVFEGDKDGVIQHGFKIKKFFLRC